jgi:crotonobetaine/carnitine-CoA ligase
MDRILVYLPLCHANPQMYAVGGALAAGGSVAIEPGFAAEGFFKRASRLGATGMTFIGTTLALLVQKNPQGERNHGLRFAVGGDIRLETVHAVDELFGITVHEVYGSTEMGGFVSCNTKNAMRRGSGGRVRGDMTLRIVDAEGRELQSDEVGHIALRPEQPDIMFSGYYNKPEETLKQIKDFWYYPGDLGKIDADGYVYFQGRNDDRIRRGGEMISPVQVEAYLSTVPGVLECAVVGVPDVVMGEEVKATVVVDRQIDPRVLADTVERLGGRFMVPRYIEFASSLPRTETGKVQRRLLKTLNAATHDSRAGGARCG